VALSVSTGVWCMDRARVGAGPTAGLVGGLWLGGVDGGVWGSLARGPVLASSAREKEGNGEVGSSSLCRVRGVVNG
jgi:hypothetical protein